MEEVAYSRIRIEMSFLLFSCYHSYHLYASTCMPPLEGLGLLSLVSCVCFVELLLMYIDHFVDWMGGFALLELYITM